MAMSRPCCIFGLKLISVNINASTVCFVREMQVFEIPQYWEKSPNKQVSAQNL